MAANEADGDEFSIDNLEWVDNVTEYKCTKCEKVLVEHYIATCDHKFCSACKQEVDAGSQRWRCPKCNVFIRKLDRQDSKFKDTVRHLRVHCPNRKYGCEHICYSKDIKVHLEGCEYKKDKALSVLYHSNPTVESLERMLSAQLLKLRHEMKKNRTPTVTNTSSQILALEAKVKSLEEDVQHQMSDVKQRIETMNEKMLTGEKKCEESDGYSNLAVLEKVNEAEKLQSKQTLLPELQVYNSIIKPEVQHHRRVSEYYKESPDFTWIANVQGLMAGSVKELLSDVFLWKKYPFSAQIKMTIYEQSEIWFELSFNDRKETNKPIEIRPLFNIYLTLNDQSKSKELKNIIKMGYAREFEEKFKYNNFSVIGVINKSILQLPPYNVQDKVFMGIQVEPLEVAQMVYSFDGTLTWAIDDYQKKKEMEADDLIESYLSPYFYTDLNGYRMQLKIRLNGYGEFKNKGLSIRVVFLSGLYDEHLEKKFRYKTTINIFHPQQPHRNISKSKERDYDKWHGQYFDMGSHAEIENLLHNDTLYYEATIKVVEFPTK